MKKVTPIFVVAGAVVTLSLFVILSMLFYTPTDHVQRVSELAEQDNLRFHVAHAFFGSVGIGAYIGWTIVLAWAVIIFFRETAGELALRGISLGVAVVSGAALSELLGSSHLGGNLGYAVAGVLSSNIGDIAGSVMMGGVFLVSLAFATDYGFISYYRAARAAIEKSEADPPAPVDLIEKIDADAAEILEREEVARPEAAAPAPAPAKEPTVSSERAIEIPASALDIEVERMGDDLLTGPRPEASAADAGRILVRLDDERVPLALATEPLPAPAAEPERIHVTDDRSFRGLAVEAVPAVGEAAEDTERIHVRLDDVDLSGFPVETEPSVEAEPAAPEPPPPPAVELPPPVAVAPPAPVPLPAPAEEPSFVDEVFVDEVFQISEPEPAPPAPPEPKWKERLDSVFDALVGPASRPVAPPPAPESGVMLMDDPVLVLDDEIVVLDDERAEEPAPAAPEAAAPAPAPAAVLEAAVAPATPEAEAPAAGEAPAPAAEAPEAPAAEPVPMAAPSAAEDLPEFALDASPPPPEPEPAPAVEEAPPAGEAMLPFMREENAVPPAPPAAAVAEAPVAAPAAEEIPVLQDVAAAPRPLSRLRSLFRRRKPEPLFAPPAPAADGDPVLERAAEICLTHQRGSVVLLQRQMDLGYTRASKVVEALEKAGLLGPLTESGSREVLMTREQWQARPRAE